MKSSNTIVTIVVIAAVLIGAYAVGMLIHQAREGSPRPDANDAQVQQGSADLPRGPGSGRPQDSPEARAQLKDKRAEALEKMESATEEEKAKFREQVRQRFSGERTKKSARRQPPRPPETPNQPSGVQDPNAQQSSSEPNAAGQG